MKNLLFSFTLLLLPLFASSQNCGIVQDFRITTVNNGDGTADYTFEVDVVSTSGGTKSVNLSISCPNNSFITNVCVNTSPTVATIVYGPYTVTTCAGGITLDWIGRTNQNCGGTQCAGQIGLAGNSLPVEMVSFKTERNNKSVLLQWETAQEINNDGFVIEQSIDGRDWKNIGWVAGAGTVESNQVYAFTDNHPEAGMNYYRLKQVDFDGQFSFSEIRTIKMEEVLNNIGAYPNPTKGIVNLSGLDATDDIVKVKVSNAVGKTVLETSGILPTIDLSAFENGRYFIMIQTDNEMVVEQIVKF